MTCLVKSWHITEIRRAGNLSYGKETGQELGSTEQVNEVKLEGLRFQIW